MEMFTILRFCYTHSICSHCIVSTQWGAQPWWWLHLSDRGQIVAEVPAHFFFGKRMLSHASNSQCLSQSYDDLWRWNSFILIPWVWMRPSEMLHSIWLYIDMPTLRWWKVGDFVALVPGSDCSSAHSTVNGANALAPTATQQSGCLMWFTRCLLSTRFARCNLHRIPDIVCTWQIFYAHGFARCMICVTCSRCTCIYNSPAVT